MPGLYEVIIDELSLEDGVRVWFRMLAGATIESSQFDVTPELWLASANVTGLPLFDVPGGDPRFQVRFLWTDVCCVECNFVGDSITDEQAAALYGWAKACLDGVRRYHLVAGTAPADRNEQAAFDEWAGAEARPPREYSEADLEVVDDAIDFVRSHPRRFLRSVPADARELATHLVSGVAVLTTDRIALTRSEDWWIVSSPDDWLIHHDGEPYAVFERMIAFPEAGINSCRPEILIPAFASHAVTVGSQGRHVIVGDVQDDEPIWRVVEWELPGRVVAFTLE